MGMRNRFTHNVDTKNRLFIPSKFREELGSEYILTPSLRDPCLTVRSKANWEAYLEPIKRIERKDSEVALRRLEGRSAEVSHDSQGRIIIPPSMLEFAHIEKEAIIIGCGEYVEIWSAEVRREHEEMEANDDSWMQVLESHGL